MHYIYIIVLHPTGVIALVSMKNLCVICKYEYTALTWFTVKLTQTVHILINSHWIFNQFIYILIIQA